MNNIIHDTNSKPTSGGALIHALCTAIFLLLSLPLQASAGSPEQDGLRLGVFPYMAARQIVESFGPIVASMESALKHPVKLESAASFQNYIQLLEEQQFDIALIQPFDYPKVVDEYRYLPLVRQNEPLITRLMVREDSTYHSLKELRGTTIALPPEPSANARMAIRALHDNKLIPGRDITVTHFKSHDSCLQQVWVGEASACGTSNSPLQVFERRMQARLRSIYDTPPIPHTLFVIHPRVPAETRARLLELITGWSQTDDGRAMMKALGFPGFVPAKPSDYAVIRNYDPVVTTPAKVEPKPAKELTFGVFPYISARVVAQNFATALPALRLAADRDIILRSAANFDAFDDAIIAAQYDLVLVQPFDFDKASKHGYLPLAGMKDTLQGKFRVLENSPYRQVSDFKGKVIALPPVDSAQARLGRKALQQAGLTPGKDVTIEYRKNHESCIQLMRSGAAVACSTSDVSLAMIPKEMQLGLRDVGLTEKVPGVVFMAHKRIPQPERKKLQNAIVSWKDSAEGREILKSIQFGEFIPVDSNDYVNMKKFD